MTHCLWVWVEHKVPAKSHQLNKSIKTNVCVKQQMMFITALCSSEGFKDGFHEWILISYTHFRALHKWKPAAQSWTPVISPNMTRQMHSVQYVSACLALAGMYSSRFKNTQAVNFLMSGLENCMFHGHWRECYCWDVRVWIRVDRCDITRSWLVMGSCWEWSACCSRVK